MTVEAAVFARLTPEAARLARLIVARLCVAGLHIVLNFVVQIAGLRFVVVCFGGRSGVERLRRGFIRKCSGRRSLRSIATTAELGNRFARQDH